VADAGDVFGNYRILFKTMGELLYLGFGCQVSQVEEVHGNEEDAEVGLSSGKNLRFGISESNSNDEKEEDD
jgi:hypothetical protein